ncbi:cytochrome P450 313b1 [Glossina fuscipes fuscipes]
MKMSPIFIILIFTLLLLLFNYVWSRRKYYKVYWQLPGPLGLPFIGLGLSMLKPEKLLQFVETLSQNYKTPFILWMGGKCFLYVNDPKTVETVFHTTQCLNKGDFYNFVSDVIGDGLFTSSAPRWQKHRRLIQPCFNRQVLYEYIPIFNKEANALLHKLSLSQDQPLEIYGCLKQSVLGISCLTTMGKKMDFQHDETSSIIFDSYNSLIELCVKRMLSPWLYPNVIYHCSKLSQRQQQSASNLRKFVEQMLQQGHQKQQQQHQQLKTSDVKPSLPLATPSKALHHTSNNNESNNNDNCKIRPATNVSSQFKVAGVNTTSVEHIDDGGDSISKSKAVSFIKKMLNCIELNQLTWQEVRDEANVIVAATFETTSTALYLVCLCLAMHPKCQEKLYHELDEIFSTVNHDNQPKTIKGNIMDNKQSSLSSSCNKENTNKKFDNGHQLILDDITIEQLERMQYTEMVINEAMRLFAPVPIVLRRASGDFRLTNGVLIPEGTQIAIDIYNMQRSIQIWGPNAKQFRPEEHFCNNALNHEQSFAFVPFTKGLRMCIGYRYALLLMKIMLAKIFVNFRLHTTATLDDLKVKGTISLKLQHYPLCKVGQRTRQTKRKE